ncbi:MAG: ComEC/Rec2 family competence protein [Acidobacteriota bacterium]|nr:ComEC/Rec2 family competence protein [Acidobacteriota bacterium]
MNSKIAASANFALYPLFWLAVCFALGITAADFLWFGWQFYALISSLSAVCALVFINRKNGLIFLYAAFAALGALSFHVENQPVPANRLRTIYDENRVVSGDPIEIEGVVKESPELAVGGFFLVLNAEKAIYKEAETEISGCVKLFVAVPDEQTASEYAILNLNYGSRIRVACRLRRENGFLNAGGLSQTAMLDQQAIDATGIIKSPLLVEKIGETETFLPLVWIYEFRRKLTIDFRDNFNVPTAGVLNASLLGNDNFLDKPTADVFRDGGTFHVLVISGLHITFIGGLILLFVRFFTNRKLWQFVIATVFLWSYAVAVGANVPVIRATLMFTILLFSQVIYRNGTLLNALGLCGLILLAWRPSDVFTSSFQLTFASVGAIVLAAFPLIEKLRAIGSWSPTLETPLPPRVPVRLKRFCEMLYWRERVWEIESAQQLWTARLFKSPYLKRLEAKNRQTVLRYFFEAVLVSLIVQAWLLPLAIIYFHRLSLLTVFLNIWVGIFIALESFAAIFAVALVNISGALALPFVKIAEMLNWLLIAVPDLLTDNNWAAMRIPYYSGAMKAVYIVYFAPLIYFVGALNSWQPFALDSKFRSSFFKIFTTPKLKFAALGFASLLFLIVFHPFSAPFADGRLHVDFLDVGQGDSALLTFPNGETLLVDGGGKMNFNRVSVQSEYEDEPEIFEPDTTAIGEAVVSNFLWAKGYSRVDYILATHADADHIQGLSDIADNFSVRAAIFGRTPLKNAEYANLHRILQKHDIESVTVSRGDVLTFGAVVIEVLYPEKTADAEAVSDNNHSIVLRVDYGARKFLLTGDIEKEVEKYLLNAPEFIQTDVIKVAHHGSRTSSAADFIAAANAKIAVISVGKNSPFGHPRPEVVERWKAAGVKVLTTGENGTISFSTDGSDLQLTTFGKQKIYR